MNHRFDEEFWEAVGLVKGRDIAPVYEWLTSKELNGKMDVRISWNFQKFLVDEEGRLFDVLSPRESPMSEAVINWITQKYPLGCQEYKLHYSCF